MEPKCATGTLNTLSGLCESSPAQAPSYSIIWSMYQNCSDVPSSVFSPGDRICARTSCTLETCSANPGGVGILVVKFSLHNIECAVRPNGFAPVGEPLTLNVAGTEKRKFHRLADSESLLLQPGQYLGISGVAIQMM